LWGDFADSQKHSCSLLDLWMGARNVNFKVALTQAAEWLGYSLPRSNASTTPAKTRSTPASPLDWHACVKAFTETHVERLAKWRGYSIEFCRWVKECGLVGLYDGCIAFPVHDRAGNVVAAHYRAKNGRDWFYNPKGAEVRPLIVGELVPGDTVHIFESQWDAFAFMDVSGERHGIIITRGASNGALVAEVIPIDVKVYVWPQNDRAGEKWTRDTCVSAKTKAAAVMRPKFRLQFKDINDCCAAARLSMT